MRQCPGASMTRVFLVRHDRLVSPGFARRLDAFFETTPDPPSPLFPGPGMPVRPPGAPLQTNNLPGIGSVASPPAAAPVFFFPGICPSNNCQKTQLTCLKTVFCGDVAPAGAAQCLTICKNLLTSTPRRVIYSRVRTASLRRSVGHAFCVGYEDQGEFKENQRRNGQSKVKIGRKPARPGPALWGFSRRHKSWSCHGRGTMRHFQPHGNAAGSDAFFPGICPSNNCQKTQLTCLKTVFCGDVAPAGAAQCLTICKNLLTSTPRRVIYSRVRTASLRRSVGHAFCVGYEDQGEFKENQRRNGQSKVKIGRKPARPGPALWGFSRRHKSWSCHGRGTMRHFQPHGNAAASQ